MTEQELSENKQPETRRCNTWAKTGILFSTFAIIVFIFGFGYGYFELSKVNIQLAQRVADLQQRAQSGQRDITELQKSVTAIQQSIQKSQELSTQQEKIMSEWRAAQQGDLNKWHAAEAESLTKMANDQLQFGHSIKTSVLLLQQADKELQNAQDPALLEVRKSLASDLTNLQALPQVDVTSVFLRLNALNDLVDKLPLPVNPLKANSQQNTTSPISSQTPWWKVGLETAWEGLNKIVIIRKNESNSLPLVLPDEKVFLYQNLHAQIESAGWGLLHTNADVYTASLARSVAWIQQYFVQDAQETKTMLQNLAELQKINIQPVIPSLSGTLRSFDNYFAQVKAGQSIP